MVTPDAIAATEDRIRPHIRTTPVIEANGSDFGLEPFALHFKLEALQYAGSFKTRGAFANLLGRDIGPSGVAAASGGNHGAAVAYAARQLHIPARIFVPTISSPAKIQFIRECGADLVIGGDGYAAALAACEESIAQTGAVPIHAFDQYETILGQGTLALEFDKQAPKLDTLLVGVGGGGLIAGIAAWFANRIKVVGVEPELAPTLTAALSAGAPVDAPAGGIAADSLAPRCVGAQVLPLAREFVDHVLLVPDDAIRQAQKTLWRVLRVVAEPGGAAAFAALLNGRYRPAKDERVGVVVSGGNTTAVDFDR